MISPVFSQKFRFWKLACQLLVMALLITGAGAWPRLAKPDADLVKEAEVIAVGHIKPESIVMVLHKNPPGAGRSWEHHATLVVTELLKGETRERAIPIVIHYGLDPVLGRFMDDTRGMLNNRQPGTDKQAIEIYDTGGMDARVTGDIRQDQIWILRHFQRGTDDKTLPNLLGVREPQNIQPLEKRPALRNLLEAK